jgi:hypothetical protein
VVYSIINEFYTNLILLYSKLDRVFGLAPAIIPATFIATDTRPLYSESAAVGARRKRSSAVVRSLFNSVEQRQNRSELALV